jgi:DNA-binding protein Fis
MRRADNNQTIASRMLGISQPALSKRLKLQRR